MEEQGSCKSHREKFKRGRETFKSSEALNNFPDDTAARLLRPEEKLQERKKMHQGPKSHRGVL